MSTAAARDWANLPIDLLGEITNRLTLRDYRCFRRVCTTWASVKFPFMPYLLLPGDDGEYRSLLSPTDHAHLPAPAIPVLRGKWCFGSQDNWLATLDKSGVSLLNIFTGGEIKLPAFPAHPRFDTVTFYRILRAYWIFDYIPWEFRHLLPKIVFAPNPSPASYTAVALLDSPAKFMYTRAGEDDWTTAAELERAQDVIYRDGRFLAVFDDGETVAVDLRVDGRPSELIAGGSANSSSHINYLVDSTGDLLHVRRYFRHTIVGDGSKVDISTSRIQVLRWDAKQAVWAPVKSLGDRSLFVGTPCSFFLSVQEVPGLKGNCVYFSDDSRTFLWSGRRRASTCDVGVFNLEYGSIEPCLPPIPSPKSNWRPPIWIIPPKAYLDAGEDILVK